MGPVALPNNTTSSNLLQRFEPLNLPVKGGNLFVRRSGNGPAVLLLHGFPETHLAWRKVAPLLAEHFTVVVADLPGYGDSLVSRPNEEAHPFSKRSMARMLVEAMSALDLPRFAVVGHDRGGRVAYRLALDHPDRVTGLGVLDVIPNLEIVERMTYAAARRMANWFWLAQPTSLPEATIGNRPEQYLNHVIDEWGGTDVIERDVFEEYASCIKSPPVAHAICEDYRAGDTVDVDHDRADRVSGRRIGCPTGVLWATDGILEEFGDPLAIWRTWADDVRGRSLPTGRFIMEEAPEETCAFVKSFLGALPHHAT